MRAGQRPEFSGQRERQQEIPGGHLLLELAFQPLLAFMVLAVRAVTMAAGVRHQRLVRTFAALELHLEAGLGAAPLHGRERPVVIRGKPVAVLRQKVRLERFDDRSQAGHLTCPQAMVKPSIKPLIRSSAWCLV